MMLFLSSVSDPEKYVAWREWKKTRPSDIQRATHITEWRGRQPSRLAACDMRFILIFNRGEAVFNYYLQVEGKQTQRENGDEPQCQQENVTF